MSEKRLIEAAVEDVATRFSNAATSTILYENKLKHVLEIGRILQLLPDDGVLVDVGGGLGVNLMVVRRFKPRARLVLIDRFEEYTDGNRMGSQQTGKSLMDEHDIQIIETDFWPSLSLELPDSSVDVATSFDVVEHLPGNPLQHFGEIKRVLKPGGHFFLGAPNAASLMKRVKLALGQHPYMYFNDWMAQKYYEHFREYTVTEYGELLKRSGFEVLNVWPSDAITRARALNCWHHQRHSSLSPHGLALRVAGIVEAAVPALRQSVYAVGRKLR